MVVAATAVTTAVRVSLNFVAARVRLLLHPLENLQQGFRTENLYELRRNLTVIFYGLLTKILDVILTEPCREPDGLLTGT